MIELEEESQATWAHLTVHKEELGLTVIRETKVLTVAKVCRVYSSVRSPNFVDDKRYRWPTQGLRRETNKIKSEKNKTRMIPFPTASAAGPSIVVNDEGSLLECKRSSQN